MRTQPLVVIDTNVLNEVFGSENLTYNIFLGFENEFNTGRDISYFTDDSTHRQINSLSNQVNE
ncbi:MAG: hypothetical protein DRP42_04280 [Tenericutes bacterium]|nr:MAG: hypothetical protein DRP42_04280 [Mycoplasmatota bacterium]